MDDTNRYHVFFECHSLLEGDKKKIETHFRIRRLSGGGDCGPLRRVNDTVYSVVYKDHEDQKRVLQRSQHVVDLATGPLVLTVRDSLEPSTSAPIITSSQGQDFTAPIQSSLSSPTSTFPLCGEEYELRPDAFLIRYLNDCPKAWTNLQKNLSSVACSAQLYPEEGRVLVQSLAHPGDVDGVRNWKAEVDKLFESYLCHYEVDPHKVKALRQSCSSHQTTDEVKVYSESVMAVVVVGECAQVNARLMGAVDLHTKQVAGLSEEQSSVRQLGEVKLRLLWKEIEHSLGRDFPDLKVTQGDVGKLVLEGLVEDILKAGDMISVMEKSVLERTVSDISPLFLAFLRKAYGGPEGLRDYLGVGDKFEVELRDTELCFFTMCADKLYEAENILQEHFKEVTIHVPNCSAVPPELREKLKSQTNEMNQGQYRAQVMFGPEGTISLLGHTKQVEELSEAITQLILDQASVEGKVIVPFPELVQGLPELLELHKFDYSGVTLHPLTSSPEPMVVLKGPSNKVTEVRNRLGPFLDSLVQERLTNESLGTVGYFHSSTKKDELQRVAENFGSLNLSGVNTAVASYNLLNGIQVLVCQGDITKQDADALVNAANEDLDHGVGVAAALSKAGGPQVQKESSAIVKQTGKIPTGEVVVTTGGNLNCKRLLHAVGPIGGKSGGKERLLLEKTVHSALNVAEMMQLKSIAMPCISSGLFGVSVPVCSEAIVTAVKEFGSQGERSLSRIILIDNRREVVEAMQEACDRLLRGESSGHIAPRAGGATAGATGDGVHVEIIQGTIETQQVDAVVSPMVGHDPLSTRVGHVLFKKVGRQLTAKFREEAVEETMPGDPVPVEGLPGLPFNAVFFLNLAPWDDDKDGTAVEVLRMAINNILTSCDRRGFGAVAFPVLGTGIALRFPVSVVARVLLEQVHAFEQERASRTPLLVRIVIYPNDEEAIEAFNSVQEAYQLKGLTKDFHQPDQGLASRRIVLLGKTGAGKSNLGNTIFGEKKLFTTNHSPNSGTSECQAETRSVNGRSITLIDTPGFFDVQRSEKDLKREIVNCITECAPGPHAFLIVLKVEKFTKHEQEVITKICQCFSEDALKYAVIVFTHGEQLPKGQTIEEFVGQNENLSDLVKKCGGRCHVIDNKYWKNKQQDDYRSNHLQVEDLLDTVDKMVMENNGGHYINKMFQAVEEEIQKEEEHIRGSSGNMPQDKIRNDAKRRVCERFLIRFAGTATGALLGAFFGLEALVGLVTKVLQNPQALMQFLKSPLAKGTAAVTGGEVALIVAGAALGVTALTGGIIGGTIGCEASEGAKTIQEATEMAVEAVVNERKTYSERKQS